MQTYLRIEKDLEDWFNSLPPKGKSRIVNQMIRVGLAAEKQQEDEKLSLLRKIYAKLESGIQIQANEAQPENDFSLDGLQSMAIIED